MINKMVMLRCKVPSDVERITFNEMRDCDDMYYHLWSEVCNKVDHDAMCEIWLWGGLRYNYMDERILERWSHSFTDLIRESTKPPDVIFARGGFKEYVSVMKAHPNAFRIYYGAGKRFNPKMVPDDVPYDLVLCDTVKQRNELTKLGYTTHLFTKPACDIIFKPVPAKKEFDVVFIANAPQKKLKGHEWFFKKVEGAGLRILQIGHVDDEVIKWARDRNLNIRFTGWIPRKDIPAQACRALVGVCCSTSYESCPRVIPEYLAMNLPIVVRNTTRVSTKYVNEHTGIMTDDDHFLGNLLHVISKDHTYSPYSYYLHNLSTDIASTHLATKIRSVMNDKARRQK